MEGRVDLAFERDGWISERQGGGAAKEDTVSFAEVERCWDSIACGNIRGGS